MKAHSSGFKNQLKELGRELRGIITYGNVTLEDEINSISLHYNADILKSVMKQLDLELSVDIPLETVINCQVGIIVNEQYEMINYGNYVVYNSEKQEDTGTYKITCYDKLLYSMKQNEDLGVNYPITIKNYLTALGNKIGLNIATGTFYNQDLTIPSELYVGLEYTYRDILDEIAQATGSIICLNVNDEIVVKYPTQTNDTIDEDYLKDINVDFGQKYGPINSIVLSRAAESDNVYLQDVESVQENGLCEIKIVDNQIMNFNNRSDFLQGILYALDGLYYYINDFNSTGILYYEVGDIYNVQVEENTYQCLMLNDEINVTTGIEEIIHTDMPEQSETDYEKADKTDRKINQTYLIVDKQNQTIESVVTNVTEQNNKISQITQTVDEINSKIQDIADITTYGESDRALVELNDINESEPVMIKVHPTSTNISYLYPRSNLYPSDTLYMPDRIIRFTRTYEEDGQTLTENIDYELPDDLLRYSDTVYDEFYLSYESQTCQVTKRCAYNADGTVRALGTEITTDYPYPQIILGDGNYVISLPGYDYGYVYARLMAKNIYTDQFYTKAETNSQIAQSARDITISVDQTLTNYSTTDEMNAAISVSAGEINSVVSHKVGENEIISKINQSAEAVTINADKINLAGKTINLTSDDIAINSTKFKVDKNGNVTANSLTSNNATITGGKIKITGSNSASDLLRVENSSNSSIFSYIQPVGAGFVGSSGRVDIMAKGSSSNHSLIDISGSTTTTIKDNGITSQGIYNNTSSSSANMRIDSSGVFYRATGSSKRWKTDISKNIEERLNPQKLYDLPIKQFKYKPNYLDKKDVRYGKNILGFIAEDVQEIYEPATEYDEDGQVEMWNSDVIIPAMLKLIQEQHTEIEQMKKEIEELKGGNK